MLCPCGTGQKYQDCCGVFHQQIYKAHTAEQLMRSRYTAFCLSNILYIKNTMKQPALDQFDPIETEKWLKKLKWISLDIINKSDSGISEGFVEFKAKYIENGFLKCIHENSRFEKMNGEWFYVQGEHTPVKSILLTQNQLCPCGSLKKYKNCHGSVI